MTVSYGAQGSGATAQGSVNIPYVTGLSSGDYIVCVVASGDTSNSIPTETGDFTQLATGSGGAGTFGNQTGPRRATIFGQDSDGTESGTETFTHTGDGNDVIGGIMYRFSKTETTWDIVGAGGGYDQGAGANVSVDFGSMDLASGDHLLLLLASNDDTQTFSGHTFTATGLTFTETELLDTGSTTGDDVRFVAVRATVDSGSATTSLVYTATEDEAVGAAVIRLRDTSGGASVNVGLASETDTALALTATPGTVSVAAGLASETDTALPVTAVAGAVSVAVGVAIEADTSLAATATPGAVAASIGLASEADSGLAATVTAGAVQVAVGLAAEADSALALTATAGGVVGVGIAAESDTALPITPVAGAVSVAIGIASETDTALALPTAAGQVVALGLAATTDTALAVAASITPVEQGTGFAGVLAVLRGEGREQRQSVFARPRVCPVSAHRLEAGPDGYWVCPFDGLAYR